MEAYRGLDKLIPSMRKRVVQFLANLKGNGVFNVIITESWRSPERQEYLYSLGRTQPGQIVTNTLKSKHILGEAIDIAFEVNGNISYDGDWEKVAKIGEQCGLEWGGRWVGFQDKPHFQFNHNFKTMFSPAEQNIIDFCREQNLLGDPEGFIEDFAPYKMMYLAVRCNPDLSKKLDEFLSKKLGNPPAKQQ